MEPSADVLYGPNPIQKPGTVTVPKDLLREIGVAPGDRVHWALNPEVPGTLVLVPSVQVSRAMPTILEALRVSAR